jgi:hypothetical protein
MKRATIAIVVVVILAVGSVAAIARLRRGAAGGSLPAATVSRTAFIDYLQLRG